MANKTPARRGPAQNQIPDEEIARAKRDASAEIKRRDERGQLVTAFEHFGHAHDALKSWRKAVPPDLDPSRIIAKLKLRIWQLGHHGCANDREDELQAAHRILRARGFGKKPAQRAIYGAETDGRLAADKKGKATRAERKVLDERRAAREQAWKLDPEKLTARQRSALDDLDSAVTALLPDDPTDRKENN